ncbi:pyridoxal-dependent decarboxylase, partial [Escherichia coli]
VLRWYGAEGLQHHVREHVALAHDLASWVDADPRLELAAPTNLSLVCLRHRDGEAATQRMLDTVNASGRALVTHTRLDDRLTMRVSVGQAHT